MSEFRIVGSSFRLVRQSSALLGASRSRELEVLVSDKGSSEAVGQKVVPEEVEDSLTDLSTLKLIDRPLHELASDELKNGSFRVGSTTKLAEQKLNGEVAGNGASEFSIYDMPYEISPKASGWTCTLKPLANDRSSMLQASTPRRPPHASPRILVTPVMSPKISPKTPTEKIMITPPGF